MNADQLMQLSPMPEATATAYAQAFNATFQQFEIITPRQVRYFIAQSYHETQGFTKWVENLNYSKPTRLVEVWPTRFTLDPNATNKAYAPNYVKNPQALANLVYAYRNGNGGPESGDGWSYRGRGAFHLTFRNNYAAASSAIYADDRLVQDPDLVQDIDAGIKTAGWFWHVNGLNSLAEADQFTRVTGIINGSTVTVPQRLVVLKAVNNIF